MSRTPVKMTVDEVMDFLKEHGNESTKKIYVRHGAREPFDGVKVSDLKTLVKKIKKDHALSLQLFDTGNSDAMYLAGLIADADQMTEALLNDWADKAYWYMISEFTVPWTAADSGHGRDLAMRWMQHPEERFASAGWATYSSILATRPDEELDHDEIRGLLEEVKAGVHDAQNRVRMTMNAFVIAVGSYVPALSKEAKAVARAIGKVQVDLGDTACKVPLATEYIAKVEARGTVGKKRKGARC